MLITKFLKACRQKQGKGLARLLSYKPSANSEENPKKEQQDHIQRIVQKSATPDNY